MAGSFTYRPRKKVPIRERFSWQARQEFHNSIGLPPSGLLFLIISKNGQVTPLGKTLCFPYPFPVQILPKSNKIKIF
jgi:hypothetical protein